MIRRLVKLVLFLALLAVIGVGLYAYLGDLSPETAEQARSVTLDGQ